MGNSSPTLSKGSGRVGRGHNIPLNHPFWYPTKPNAPQHLHFKPHQLPTLLTKAEAFGELPSFNSSILSRHHPEYPQYTIA
jgi:hypothetical protein